MTVFVFLLLLEKNKLLPSNDVFTTFHRHKEVKRFQSSLLIQEHLRGRVMFTNFLTPVLLSEFLCVLQTAKA